MDIDPEEHIEKSNASDTSSDNSDSLPQIVPISELDAHSDSVCAVAFHPTNPEIFATGGIDEKAFCFNGLEYRELTGHSDTIVQVKFSYDGEYLALASMDSTVTVWQVSSLDEPIAKLEGPSDEVLSIEWHPRGPVIAISAADMSV